MSHDIFISYSTKDKEIADIICNTLESNGLKCWIAPRNIRGGEEYAKEIMTGLETAKMVVLVFSKNSQESVFCTNEIANAFEKNKAIISFKIDETLPEKKMGYYLKNKHWLDASDNYENLLENLVIDAKRLCNEYIPPKKSSKKNIKIPILIAITLIFIAGGFILFSGNAFINTDSIDINSTNSTSNDIIIDYVGMDDDRDKGYSWKYSYFVFGSIPNNLNKTSKNIIHIDFYDKSNKIVKTNDTDVNKIKGNILGIAYVNKNNIVKVHAELRDNNGKVISSAESENII